jgi:hypothetical protein
VDTWTVLEGRDQDFIAALRMHLPETIPVFRDLGQDNTYWCPRIWEDTGALETWHSEVGRELDAIVSGHATHLMESVT